MRASIGAAVAAAVALAQPVRADDGHGHAGHGTAPDVGSIHFPVACNAEAQARFDLAMTLQHSFWYQAALERFREVRAADPDCVMAYWGEAMSLLLNPFNLPSAQNLEAGRALLADAQRIGAKSPRDAALIDALAVVFAGSDPAGHRARLARYAAAMEQVQARFPDEPEVAIQFALALLISAPPTDKSYANQLRAAAILEAEFARQPKHPGVAHYLIHTYDVPALASRGLDAASRYADLAPDAAHALHMPSHIFTRVGAWEESVATNRRSAATARANRDLDEELHALDYMAYAYLQLAQDQAMRPVLDEVARIGPAALQSPRNAGPFGYTAIPARWVLERGDWAAAAQLLPQPSRYAYTTATTHFARAIGLARSGRPAEASEDIAALGAIAETLKATDAYWAEQVAIQRLGAEGWAAVAAGQRDAGLALLREAAERESRTEKSPVTPGPLAPARELLAEALLEAGQPGAALAAFEAVLRTEPRRYRAEAGALRAATAAGQGEAAKRHAAALLAIAAKADTPRPEIALAQRVASGG